LWKISKFVIGVNEPSNPLSFVEEDEEELLSTLALPTDEAEEEHREGSGMSLSYSNDLS